MDKEYAVYTYIHACAQWNISHKKEGNNAICGNTDEPRDDHTEQSKSRKDKYQMVLLIRRISNMIQMNLFIKQKKTHRKQTYRNQRENVGGRDKLGIWH